MRNSRGSIWVKNRSFQYMTLTCRPQHSLSSLSITVEDIAPGYLRRLNNIHGLPIIHTQSYVCALPKGHRFQMNKFSGVYDCLVRDGVIDPKKQVLEPHQVNAMIAAIGHTPEYVNKFFKGLTTKDEQRRTGFKWTEGLASRVRYETGGTILACLVALERGLACSTAGGTHHAGPDYGSGYCLINDLAVASLFLSQHAIPGLRILIIDLDVHQDTLPSLLDQFRPGFVLYDAGVDVHEKDDLGRLSLSDAGLMQRDEFVLSQCVGRGIPIATVIGGGYDRDLAVLSHRHSFIHRKASHIFKKLC